MFRKTSVSISKIIIVVLCPFLNKQSHAFSQFQKRRIIHFRSASTLRVSSEAEEDVILFSSEEPPLDPSVKRRRQKVPWKKNAKWNSTPPKIKLKIIREAHERAIRNKKKREPIAEKKRRLMQLYKEAQKRKKRESKVLRPLSFADRTPLSELSKGSELNGTVISIVDFGVYVDVGTECDGLLHVSQITRDEFVDHPRQFFTPGMTVDGLLIRNLDPKNKKLQLTMLPLEESFRRSFNENDQDRIHLSEIDIDDELWGEIRRVTAYGAYVELGTEVDGFLHFMDHPDFGLVKGATPKEFMSVGDRVRVWVADCDRERRRIKLTANRPASLPILRREMIH